MRSDGRITCEFDVRGREYGGGGEAEGETRVWNIFYVLACIDDAEFRREKS